MFGKLPILKVRNSVIYHPLLSETLLRVLQLAIYINFIFLAGDILIPAIASVQGEILNLNIGVPRNNSR